MLHYNCKKANALIVTKIYHDIKHASFHSYNIEITFFSYFSFLIRKKINILVQIHAQVQELYALKLNCGDLFANILFTCLSNSHALFLMIVILLNKNNEVKHDKLKAVVSSVTTGTRGRIWVQPDPTSSAIPCTHPNRSYSAMELAAEYPQQNLTVITEVEPQVPCVRLRGRINLNFSTTYAVDCGA